jgi:hypothetical protein
MYYIYSKTLIFHQFLLTVMVASHGVWEEQEEKHMPSLSHGL